MNNMDMSNVVERRIYMLANVNRSLLLTLLIIAFVVAIVVIIGGVILAIVKAIKNKSSNSKKIIVCTFGSIIIAAVSWILNFGWLRFFMTFLLVPVIHGIVFFLSNMFFAKYTDQSPKMSRLNLLFIITYLIAYLLMPDGGDVGEMYFFFGLIHSDALSSAANFISSIAVIGHIVLFVMQIVEIRKIKKNTLENQ